MRAAAEDGIIAAGLRRRPSDIDILRAMIFSVLRRSSVMAFRAISLRLTTVSKCRHHARDKYRHPAQTFVIATAVSPPPYTRAFPRRDASALRALIAQHQPA